MRILFKCVQFKKNNGIFQTFKCFATYRFINNNVAKSNKCSLDFLRTCRSVNFQLYDAFHSSPSFFKRRKTAEERKAERIIEYAPKFKGEIVSVWCNITVRELAEVLNKDIQYVRDIFLNAVDHPDTIINDMKLLQLALRRSGRRMNVVAKPTDIIKEIEERDVFPRPPPTNLDCLKPRPPVVTVMGHVDHGKTTLLDALRNSRVVDQEFGGITQHIGAFSVLLENGARRITFLDTPGHAAFAAMRERGANVTDIVVLVVAADDGVMEQTIESIRMARKANVTILVAINKIDAPKADIKRTEEMLVQVGIQTENLGGDVQAIPISALKRTNLDKLTEALILQADMLDLKGDPTGAVEAVVIESQLDPSKGKLCTVVVQRGTLRKGDILVAGTAMAKARVLRDETGANINEVSPGFPAVIEGWKELPSAGEQVLQVDSEKKAREVVRFRENRKDFEKSLDDLKIIEEKQQHHLKEYQEQLNLKRKLGRFKLKSGPRKPEIDKVDDGIPVLSVIVKSDVDGTLEALLNVIDSYQETNCKLDLVHYSVGPVTANDVELAKVFNAIIYTFNVDSAQNIKTLAESEEVNINDFKVIYKLVDDIKEQINARLPTKEVEDVIGEATVLQLFEVTKGRKKIPVAGCRCTSGVLRKTALYRLVRNGEVLWTGQLSEMRHLKEDVDTIKNGTECGLQLEDKTVIFQPQDVLVCFEKRVVDQKTSWDPGF